MSLIGHSKRVLLRHHTDYILILRYVKQPLLAPLVALALP